MASTSRRPCARNCATNTLAPRAIIRHHNSPPAATAPERLSPPAVILHGPPAPPATPVLPLLHAMQLHDGVFPADAFDPTLGV